ncbi:hypothetical protein [Carboxylicivirga sp. M1479]|uniref:hypothetical protein n=1 Tax=Carboxylicivirga sp. M1479 TaxID=2594476 RepID=UPI001177CF94|nr:hypothetical protein [Carboxylicivirga sp. M1479]TRX70360.1 hypothetical protein FNN09_11575 [Carboxylicivirga sp. M1479]
MHSEIDEITLYKEEENNNIDGYEEWLDEIKEKVSTVRKIVIDHAPNEKIKNKLIKIMSN